MKLFIWALYALPICLYGQVDTSKIYTIELGEALVESKSHNPNSFTSNILAIPIKTLSDQGPSALTNLTHQSSSLQVINIGGHTMKPVIRGLGGYRTVTAYQGWRYDNLQGGADHGLDFPLLGIDHVEILPGPNSLALGTDAMAGVLYFSDLRVLETGRSNALKLSGGTNGSPLSGNMITEDQGTEFIMLEDILERIQSILTEMETRFMVLIAELHQLGSFLNSNQGNQTIDSRLLLWLEL